MTDIKLAVKNKNFFSLKKYLPKKKFIKVGNIKDRLLLECTFKTAIFRSKFNKVFLLEIIMNVKVPAFIQNV